MKFISLGVLLLCFAHTASANSLYSVTCLFDGARKTYSTEVEVVYVSDTGTSIVLKTGEEILYPISVQCEVKRVEK